MIFENVVIFVLVFLVIMALEFAIAFIILSAVAFWWECEWGGCEE